MNKRGQALVEFIIVLPLMIMLILGLFDISNINIKKNSLEGNLIEVVSMYKNNETYESIKAYLSLNDEDIEYQTKETSEYVEITLSRNIDILTPGLNLILGNPYTVEVKRIIYNN